MILVKLILAHIIGDFFLQRGKWIESKERKKWSSPHLFLHVFIHFALMLLILWDLSVLPIILLITFLHYIIDGCKLTFQTEKTRELWFAVDQVAHFLVLVAAWFFYWGGGDISGFSDQFWIMLTGLLFLTYPASYFMQHLMASWSEQIDSGEKESLQGAGKYIGMLERIFVYLSLITGNAQVIGFLLAAKSVFRFGDLTRSKDRKLTEYILIGTLFSFLMAIIVGLLTTRLSFF
ncbi:DUF3307 domain-containing protein [Rhodohalobacter sulfatireducens]|uniref:DUF3307 domain-containing protein n=1 Tax=Rhodohalobacter sulfatireducens TaxID=2911366 RepID=A0ABS9KH45_9BACT|nr:DUF3307 domain-containing protein [Rhodohalobacter sulfatireducens]MCG2590163.1 DUF3307 domain-containing protein [Rhodohalobacter sulfatireducens]MDR9365254.1 DUF3307 domain-containing protein [Balneolaceae bacterium]MDR9408526.1 DUF3307 domain-containing protein [Balneolaceae bacterium]